MRFSRRRFGELQTFLGDYMKSWTGARRIMYISGLAVAAGLLLSAPRQAGASNPAGDSRGDSDAPVTLRFFGLHRVTEDPWPTVPFGSWRLTIAWRTCEPERGTWDFKQADEEVEQAAQRDV